MFDIILGKIWAVKKTLTNVVNFIILKNAGKSRFLQWARRSARKGHLQIDLF